MAGTTGKLKVFLCHASENQPIVKALYDRLVRAGYQPWMDSEILLPGMDPNLEVKKALRASDAVIVCLSRISVAQEGRIQTEMKIAQDILAEKPHGTIFLIPLRLDDVEIPFSLRDIHWDDYRADHSFERLVRSLNLRAEQLGRENGQVVPPIADLGSAAPSSKASAGPDAHGLIREKLPAIQAILEDIKREIPSDRYFEFGDDPRIVESIDDSLRRILTFMSDLRPLYESRPLREGNPYFEAARIVQDFRSFLQIVRVEGGGKILHTIQVRWLIGELETRVRLLSEGMQVEHSAPVAKETGEGAAALKHDTTDKASASQYQLAVFISYAWGDEREEIVNQIDTSLQKRGLKIIRDKRDLPYKGSIREFMEKIGKGDCVIVVISDKYLRSPNCMFELVEIAENKEFENRIFPVIWKDANIYDPLKRIEYIEHWEITRTKLARAIKKLDPANLQGIREEMDLYDRIRAKISGLTSILKDMNALTPEMHQESDFSLLYEAIEQRIRNRR